MDFLAVKQSIKIVDVVKHYLDLKKKGKNYWSICPFHSDQNPSLSISEEKNIFKCFSCQVSGDAISFVMKYHKITFIDAIKKISTLVNLDLSFLIKHENSQSFLLNKKIYKLNELIAQAHHKYLFHEDNKNYLDYLINTRKINESLIKKAQIGICLNKNIISKIIEKWNAINPSESLSEEILDSSKNFINVANKEKQFFLFNRFIFPIWNENKNIIAFSGRAIDKTNNYKYLHSQESTVFKKSESLYNIQNLIPNKPIYIFEGFFDLISSQKCEIINSVCLMGVNLSLEHIKKLKKYSQKIILSLDNDAAGIESTISLSQKLINQKFSVYIVDLLQENIKDIDLLTIHNFSGANHALNEPINFFVWYKKYWEIKNTKFALSQISEEVNRLLNIFFYESEKNISLKKDINIEFAKESLIEIFNFFLLWKEVDLKEKINQQIKKYLSIISNFEFSNSLSELKENVVEKSSKDNNFLLKFFGIFLSWEINKNDINYFLKTSEWLIDWNMLTTSISTLNNFVLLFKNFIEEKLDEEQKHLIKKYKEKQVPQHIENDIFYFFNLYYSLIKNMLNQQLQEINNNLALNFEEKINKKNTLFSQVKFVDQTSKMLFKKLLLFKK